MKSIDHPNIIYLEDYLESSNYHYLIIPLYPDGDMKNYMLRKGPTWHFPEEEAVFYMKQLCAGFGELQKKNVVHRDFKLENVFVGGTNIVIADFGAAKDLKDTKAQ